MSVNELKKKILDEIYKALGIGNIPPLRSLIKVISSPAALRFAEAAAKFDTDVSLYGLRGASQRLLPLFAGEVRINGEGQIPKEGPLLIVSNHPGTVDGLAIASSLPRSDLKIVASGIPFIRHLRATANYLIYSSLDINERMMVLRSSIRHLENGGALLIFPSGGIDPDPAVMLGALDVIDTWSPSIELLLRRVPKTRILITAVSGVLSNSWLHSPFTLLRNGRRNRQRVAEFLQVIQQMLLPKSLLVNPSVFYAEPFQVESNNHTPSLPCIISRAKEHFKQISPG